MKTGIYLAMGISKGSVLLQYLLEVVLVAAIALVILLWHQHRHFPPDREQPALTGNKRNL